jgi:plasmid stabilization system protein ParE
MQLRWTAEAATDLESIADYVLEHAPKSGARGDPSRLRSTATLLTFPNRGPPKSGRVSGS